MRPQKAIAVIMLVMSSALMAVASRDIAYPAVLCVLGLLGLARRFTWNLNPDRRVIKSWLLLLLAILFALHYRYTPRAWLGHEQTIALAWQTVARYFLASMVLILFLGSARQLPPSLGLYHIAITICVGQIFLLDDLFVLFRLLELLSVVLVVLYAATASVGPASEALRRVRPSAGWPVGAAILIVAANVGWVMGSLLYQHVEVLNYLPLWLMRQGTSIEAMTGGVSLVGFTTSGQLSSMQTVLQDQDATVALTIESRSSPGYLRARAFDVYRPSAWRDPLTQEALLPVASTPLSRHFGGRTNTFRIEEHEYSDLEYMMVRHESSLKGAAFTPPGTAVVETPLPALLRDDDGIVYAPGLAVGKSYRIGYTPRAFRQEPTGSQLRRMLSLPNPLDPRVTEMADRIFAGCTTPAEKIDAVIRHFRTQYTYSLTMDIPEDQDKLLVFLLERSTGYCEYFGSGAALLLRLAGVPTRYVTGFLVTQRGEQSGSWIARNMDAHAWAEAWDEQRRSWTIVEATVQGNLNAGPATGAAEQQGGGLGVRLKQLLGALYQYGLIGLLSWLFTSYGLFAGSLVLSTLLGWVLWWGLARLWPVGSGPGRSVAATPAVAAMHRLLARMDRRIKAAGVMRRLDETLYVFAQRLDARDAGDGAWTAIAQWYRRYADLRYARTVGAEQIHDLHQATRSLQPRL